MNSSSVLFTRISKAAAPRPRMDVAKMRLLPKASEQKLTRMEALAGDYSILRENPSIVLQVSRLHTALVAMIRVLDTHIRTSLAFREKLYGRPQVFVRLRDVLPQLMAAVAEIPGAAPVQFLLRALCVEPALYSFQVDLQGNVLVGPPLTQQGDGVALQPELAAHIVSTRFQDSTGSRGAEFAKHLTGHLRGASAAYLWAAQAHSESPLTCARAWLMASELLNKYALHADDEQSSALHERIDSSRWQIREEGFLSVLSPTEEVPLSCAHVDPMDHLAFTRAKETPPEDALGERPHSTQSLTQYGAGGVIPGVELPKPELSKISLGSRFGESIFARCSTVSRVGAQTPVSRSATPTPTDLSLSRGPSRQQAAASFRAPLPQRKAASTPTTMGLCPTLQRLLAKNSNSQSCSPAPMEGAASGTASAQQ